MGWISNQHYDAPHELGRDNSAVKTEPQPETDPPVWTWGTGNIWNKQNKCIRFNNDTDRQLKITHIAVQVVSCNSGGNGYWAWGGYRGISCDGLDAHYHMYMQVFHTASNQANFKVADVEWGSNKSGSMTDKYVQRQDSPNYITLGSSGTSTAQFGGLHDVVYEIEECPIIYPGDHC